MIHHEAWFQESVSRESLALIEQLKRGDASVLPRVVEMVERGTAPEDFSFTRVLANRHIGITPRWAFVAAGISRKFPFTDVRDNLTTAINSAFDSLEKIRMLDIYLVTNKEGRWFKDNTLQNKKEDELISLWISLDQRLLPDLSKAWEEFVRENPSAAAMLERSRL